MNEYKELALDDIDNPYCYSFKNFEEKHRRCKCCNPCKRIKKCDHNCHSCPININVNVYINCENEEDEEE